MTEDIRDIRGPILEAAGTAWWPYVVGCATIAGVIVLASIVMMRRRHTVSPYEIALRELADARALIERGDPEAFSVRVSDTVRGFVEHAFDIHAPRRTTDELLADLLRSMSPVAPYRAELGAFLEQCDLAKFARWSLSRTDMTKMIETAERFVRSMKTPAPVGGTP